MITEISEFDDILFENYSLEDVNDFVEFKHDGESYVTESVDEDDLFFLQILNEID